MSVGTEARFQYPVALVDETAPSVRAKIVGVPPRSKKEVNSAPVKVTVVVGEIMDATVSSQAANLEYSSRSVLHLTRSHNNCQTQEPFEMCDGLTTPPTRSITVCSKGARGDNLKKAQKTSVGVVTRKRTLHGRPLPKYLQNR